MTILAQSLTKPGLRTTLAIGGALLGLLAILAIVRPEMMGMGMIRHLIVGFGL